MTCFYYALSLGLSIGLLLVGSIHIIRSFGLVADDEG